MSLLHDSLIVVDIEATCWDTPQPPPNQRREIIEIGICLLDLSSFELSDTRSILVRPSHSTISEFCTNLTTLSAEMLDTEGILFDEACQMMVDDFQSDQRLWGSWGSFDRRIFQEQCAFSNVTYPFSDKYVNIKTLYSKLYNNRQPIGMRGALDQLELKLTGTHHRGVDDAVNITRILRLILQQRGVGILKRYW